MDTFISENILYFIQDFTGSQCKSLRIGEI